MRTSLNHLRSLILVLMPIFSQRGIFIKAMRACRINESVCCILRFIQIAIKILNNNNKKKKIQPNHHKNVGN